KRYMVSFQEQLNEKFPDREARKDVEKIVIYHGDDPKGGLADFREFVNLKVLDIFDMRITSLDLSNCLALKEISVFKNKISQDISVFSHLVKLRKLDLAVDMGGRENDFYGSSEALKNLKDLEFLRFCGQKKITGGLEFLPAEKLKFLFVENTEYKKILKSFGFVACRGYNFLNGADALRKWRAE